MSGHRVIQEESAIVGGWEDVPSFKLVKNNKKYVI
jgi:hypothetical protein